MDKEVYEVRLASWKQIVQQCQSRPAGITQKNWLEKHGIQRSQFYYWLRKVRREALAEIADADHKEVVPTSITGNDLAAPVAFAEIDLNKAQLYTESQQHAAAVIRLGQLTVELSNDAEDRLIAGILKAVSHTGCSCRNSKAYPCRWLYRSSQGCGFSGTADWNEV